jgi:hypothetical protein
MSTRLCVVQDAHQALISQHHIKVLHASKRAVSLRSSGSSSSSGSNGSSQSMKASAPHQVPRCQHECCQPEQQQQQHQQHQRQSDV